MSQVLEHYQALLSLTGQMRDAASNGEWDRLVALEAQCNQCLQAIVRHKDGQQSTSSSSVQKLKIDLIHQILANDAAIRTHIEPRLEQLRCILQNGRMQQRLSRSYSQPTPPA
jgi:flagellar protein FliT